MSKKISELVAVASLTGAEYVPVVQGGITMRATAAMLSGGIVTSEAFTIDGTLQKLYTIPAGYRLDSFTILPNAACTPVCSYEPVPTGTFISIDGIDPITVAGGLAYTINILAIAARQILISSVPSGSTVVFIKTKII